MFIQGKSSEKLIVLLHGFTENANMWSAVLSQWSELPYSVLCPNAPGIANAPAVLDSTLTALCAPIVAEIKQYKAKTICLMGHSMGGYMALEIAHRFQLPLAGLGLLQSTPFADDETRKANRNRMIAAIQERGAVTFLASFIPNLFQASYQNTLADQIELLQKEAKNVPSAVWIQHLAAMRDREDYSVYLNQFDFPILFCPGEADAVIAIDQLSAAVRTCKNAYWEPLAATGHMAAFENPKALASAIATFANLTLN